MIPFDKDTLETWQADYRSFNRDFRLFCFMQFRAFSVSAEFVPNAMMQIHEQWCSDCTSWLQSEVHPSTEKLSHLKMAALLLFNLNRGNFLGNFFDHDYAEEPKVTWRGTAEQHKKARADLIDARESVLSFDFCMIIIDWFERNRQDRVSSYQQPLTEDMRHDMLVYLISQKVDEKALYLILKALFLSHGNAAAN